MRAVERGEKERAFVSMLLCCCCFLKRGARDRMRMKRAERHSGNSRVVGEG